MAFVAVIAIAMGVALAACALPAAGPTVDQLEHPFDGPTFTLVKIDSRIVQILRRGGIARFGAQFHGRRTGATNTLRPGDLIAITVYETGGSSLFGIGGPTVPGVSTPGTVTPTPSVTPAGITTVPPQVIEPDGTITMPYAGRIQAVGHTPGQLGQAVLWSAIKRLRGRLGSARLGSVRPAPGLGRLVESDRFAG